MIEPPWPISGSAFWTVKIEPFTLVSKVSSMCSAVILPSGSGLPAPALAKTMSRVPRSDFTAAYRRSRSARSETELHRAGIGPEVGHSGVEFCLPAAEDEDEGTLLDEALCCGAADAGSATGDHSGLSIQSGHVVHPSLE